MEFAKKDSNTEDYLLHQLKLKIEGGTIISFAVYLSYFAFALISTGFLLTLRKNLNSKVGESELIILVRSLMIPNIVTVGAIVYTLKNKKIRHFVISHLKNIFIRNT